MAELEQAIWDRIFADRDFFWVWPVKGLEASCLYCHLSRGKRFSITQQGAGPRLHTLTGGHYRRKEAMEREVTRTGPDVGEAGIDASQLHDEGMFYFLHCLL